MAVGASEGADVKSACKWNIVLLLSWVSLSLLSA